MDLIFLRYDKDYYITDGKISFLLDQIISVFNIKYIKKEVELTDGDIVTPLILFPKEYCSNLVDYFEKHNIKINCVFEDEVEKYIYYGTKNEELLINSLYCFQDDYGNYIYVYVDKNISNVKRVIEHSSFNFNRMDIENLFVIDKELYLQDLLTNTELDMEETNKQLFCNTSKYLDIYKIMNRISLKNTYIK